MDEGELIPAIKLFEQNDPNYPEIMCGKANLYLGSVIFLLSC